MEDSSFLVDVLLPLGLAVIMVALGLSLTGADFKRVFAAPKAVGIGLANLLVISPLLAFAAAELFGLDPVLAVGLVLLGASPGGTLANLLTHLARGETALSITMTGVSSVLAVVTVPLYLGIAIDHFGAENLTKDIDLVGIVIKVLAITIVPLSLGMLYRAKRPARAIAIEPGLKRAAFVAFVFVVIGAIIAERDRFTDDFVQVAPAALLLNLAAMSVSFAIARAARLSNPQSTAISMELGIHNATLAIAVATTISTELAIPGAVYSAFMFVTAGLFARAMHRRNVEPDSG